eukprot:TRINITY_DN10354_c0_g1_i2.p2 TRINITY_DN10354_c0_g1~~TRINITY_DN10354_c0_g1_i2.p2  ORF type:complete len:161 (-),score=69.37 TRINITY_DN10354_c0_g1_i2:1116-1598(-)
MVPLTGASRRQPSSPVPDTDEDSMSEHDLSSEASDVDDDEVDLDGCAPVKLTRRQAISKAAMEQAEDADCDDDDDDDDEADDGRERRVKAKRSHSERQAHRQRKAQEYNKFVEYQWEQGRLDVIKAKEQIRTDVWKYLMDRQKAAQEALQQLDDFQRKSL